MVKFIKYTNILRDLRNEIVSSTSNNIKIELYVNLKEREFLHSKIMEEAVTSGLTLMADNDNPIVSPDSYIMFNTSIKIIKAPIKGGYFGIDIIGK